MVRRTAGLVTLHARKPQQGVPGPLVLHARRDRALRVRDPDHHRHVPQLLLRPEPRSRDVPRQLPAAQRDAHVVCISLGHQHQFRRPRRTRDAPDPPLGGTAVPRGDRGPPVPHLLHWCVPQAARDQLVRRREPAPPRTGQRVHRLLAPRRSPLRHRTPRRVFLRALDPADRRLDGLPRLRRRVPRPRHPAPALRHPHPARAARDPRPALDPPRDPLASEAHTVPRTRARGAQRRGIQAVAHLRDEERRTLHARRLGALTARRPRPDQPRLALRPVRTGVGLDRSAARLVPRLDRRRHPTVPTVARPPRSATASPRSSGPRSCCPA